MQIEVGIATATGIFIPPVWKGMNVSSKVRGFIYSFVVEMNEAEQNIFMAHGLSIWGNLGIA